MGRWRYLFADLRTNTMIAELPLYNVSFNTPLNGVGSFSGICPLTGGADIKKLDPLNATQKARTALYAESDGVLIWGGIVWASNYTSDGAGLQITASDFFSYFLDKRFIYDTLTYTGIDQLVIARDILSYAQNRVGPVGSYVGFSYGGDIGLTLGSETSGVLRDRTYNGYEAKSVGGAVMDLAQVNNGFDFGVLVNWVSNVSTKTLGLYYPRRGVAATNSGLVWEFPGNISRVGFPEDGKSTANSVTSYGAGNADNKLKSTAVDTSLIDAGYPLLESNSTHGDVTVQNTLNDWASAELKATSSPLFLPELDIRLDKDPKLGSFTPGDEFRFIYNGPYAYKQTIDTYYRILDIRYQPGEKGRPEKATLVVGPLFQ